MSEENIPFKLYISSEFNSIDAAKLGIKQGDFSEFMNNLQEYRNDMNNSCIVAGSYEIMYNLFKITDIEYYTKDAYYYGNIWYVGDVRKFNQICGCKIDKNVYESWLSVIKDISEDIDTLEDRYGMNGDFLRSLLTYVSQYTIVTELRE